MGLSTVAADQLVSGAAQIAGGGGELVIMGIDDRARFAQRVVAPGSPEFQAITTGSQPIITCRFTVQMMAPDILGSGYVYLNSGVNYIVEIPGIDAPVTYHDANVGGPPPPSYSA
jgi:hypothetical protein